MLSEPEARKLSRAMARELNAGRASVVLSAAGLLAVVVLALFGDVLLPAAGTRVPPPAPLLSLASVDTVVAHPSSAAYDPDRRMLLIGSYADGSIERVSLAGSTAISARSTWRQDGRRSVLRIRLDSERARVWVLGFDRLYLYDARDWRLLHQIGIDELSQHSREHCLPDMALDRSGAVFLSNAMEPALWRVDPLTFHVDKRKVVVDADQDQDFGFSALAFDGAGTLYAASAISGALWRVDTAAYSASKLALSSAIRGACALHAVTDSAGAPAQLLYVAGGFRDTVKRVRVAGHQPLAVTDVATAAPLVSPTDIVRINQDVMIVSSQLSDHPDFNGEGTRHTRFRIVRVKLR
jgi:hypothetical protein